MPTATVTWSFDSDSQSWVATIAGAGASMSWGASGGNPGGRLDHIQTGKNRSAAGYWELTGTWEALFGIPTGTVVSSVGGGASDGYDWRCSVYTTGAASTSGPFQLYDNTPTLQGTFSTGDAYSSTTVYARKSASSVSVPSAMQPSGTTVRMRLNSTVATGNSTSANNTLLRDTITLTVTYLSPVFDDAENDSWGQSLTTTAKGISSAVVASTLLTCALAQNVSNGDPSETVPELTLTEEDYWQNPVPPVNLSFYQPLPYLPDPEELPAGNLAIYPGGTEDYWQVVQYQPPWRGLVPQENEDFSTPLSEVMEEDYWQVNRMVVYGNAVPLFFLGDVSFTTFIGPPPEDYWGTPGVKPPPDLWFENLLLPYAFGATNEPVYGPEEDYWQNPTPPVPGSLVWPNPWQFEQNEIFNIFTVKPEEEYWLNPVKPVPPTLQRLDPNFHQDDPSGLYGQPPEDYWINAVAPVPWTFIWPQQHLFNGVEWVSSPGQIEEDYWTNPVAPVQQTFKIAEQWKFSQQVEASNLSWGMPEDYWQNPVRPVPATLKLNLPYLPEPEEVWVTPLVSVSIQEDYWINWVAPCFPNNINPFTWVLDEREPGTPVVGQPDEDYWMNPVVPVQWTFLVPPQWNDEMQDYGLGSGGSVSNYPEYPPRPFPFANRLLFRQGSFKEG